MYPSTKNARPLDDVRVLEMGQLLAGPFCGQLLGDYGCDVVKIELPGKGDPMRAWGRQDADDVSLWWPIVGRNKRSVEIDLRKPEGQELALSLIAEVDVVVENFRPGTLERWNLSFEEMKRVNPSIILVRVTGYGQTGPYAPRPGYGSIGEAMGGIRHISGDPTAPPSRVGISLGDALSGLFATIGTLVALHDRPRTNEAQEVDVALYESVFALMESLIPDYVLRGSIRERSGPVLPNVAPSNVYPSSDGATLVVAANQDTVFRRLAQAMGRPALADDVRYATHGARGAHQEELDSLIAQWSSQHLEEHLLELFELHGVPAGSVFRAPDMLNDPHFAAREAIVSLKHPVLGDFPMQGIFPKFKTRPLTPLALAPELGEHTREVLLSWLGIDEAVITEMSASGVIGAL